MAVIIRTPGIRSDELLAAEMRTRGYKVNVVDESGWAVQLMKIAGSLSSIFERVRPHEDKLRRWFFSNPNDDFEPLSDQDLQNAFADKLGLVERHFDIDRTTALDLFRQTLLRTLVTASIDGGIPLEESLRVADYKIRSNLGAYFPKRELASNLCPLKEVIRR